MSEQIPEIDAKTLQIARKTVDIIPFVMRVMSAEIRAGSYAPETAHLALMGALKYRSYTLSDLAQRMSVSLPTMSANITTLEGKGWVRRRRSDQDRRVVWIEMTDAGKAALEDMQSQTARRIAGLLEGLAPAERDLLDNGLSVLANAFATAMARDPTLE